MNRLYIPVIYKNIIYKKIFDTKLFCFDSRAACIILLQKFYIILK